MSQHLSEGCRKKAALCLLRVYRKLPEEAAIITADTWCERFQHLLSTARGTGMHLAVTALLLGVLEREGPAGYESLQPTLVHNLAAVLTGHGQFGDCLYYGIPSPWLQCKCALPRPTPLFSLTRRTCGPGAGCRIRSDADACARLRA